MSNMSYCRWYNTRLDLADCFNAFNEGEEISASEIKQAKGMIKEMCEFLYDNDVISSYHFGEVFNALDELNDGYVDDGW